MTRQRRDSPAVSRWRFDAWRRASRRCIWSSSPTAVRARGPTLRHRPAAAVVSYRVALSVLVPRRPARGQRACCHCARARRRRALISIGSGRPSQVVEVHRLVGWRVRLVTPAIRAAAALGTRPRLAPPPARRRSDPSFFQRLMADCHWRAAACVVRCRWQSLEHRSTSSASRIEKFCLRPMRSPSAAACACRRA